MLVKKCVSSYSLLVFLFILQACGDRIVNEAEKLIDSQNYDHAIEILNTEIREHPENARAHFTLGVANLHKRDTTKAIEAFERAIALSAEYNEKTADKCFEFGKRELADGKLNYANSLLKAALVFYKNSGIINKEYSEVIYLLAYSEYAAGDYKQAIESFKQLAGLNPNRVESLGFLADCFLLVANFELANQTYQTAYEAATLDSNWSGVFAPVSGIRNKGTFIVNSAEADVHLVQTDKIAGTLSKYDIFAYYKNEEKKLFFKDTKNRVHATKSGWICENFTRWKRLGQYERGWRSVPEFYGGGSVTRRTTTDEVQVDRLDNIAQRLKAEAHVLWKLPGPNAIFTNFGGYSDYLVYAHDVLGFLENLFVAEKNIKPGSLRLKSVRRDTIRAYDAERKISYRVTFAKVEFKKQIALKKWISKSNVIIGSGNTVVDRNRVDALKPLSFLTESQKQKMLGGFITKGMPKELVKYAVGNTKLDKISLVDGSVISEVYTFDSGSLEFKNNRLFQWQKNAELSKK